MRAINHALAGTLIGLSVSQPLLAVSVALASHYILDAIPHYGDDEKFVSSMQFRYLLLLDFALCVVLVIVLAVIRPHMWMLGAVCAFLATSADFMWVRGFWRAQHGGIYTVPHYLLARIHAKIQWFERPSGVWVEAICLGLFGLMLLEKLV